MHFRRRARPESGAAGGGEERVPRPPARGDAGSGSGSGSGEARTPLRPEGSITGTYLTDGRSLFRVQHAITEADGLQLDEPLLELEDCATLELILCSAGALERLGLRPVRPSHDSQRQPVGA